jgi:hypothetical protein
VFEELEYIDAGARRKPGPGAHPGITHKSVELHDPIQGILHVKTRGRIGVNERGSKLVGGVKRRPDDMSCHSQPIIIIVLAVKSARGRQTQSHQSNFIKPQCRYSDMIR